MGGQRKKLVVVGDERVGKTALLLVYCGAPFPEQHFSTVSDSYTNANSQYYELCDTAGTQEFDRLRPFSYDNADAFLIAFSIDDPLSLENVEEKWVHEVRYFSAKVPILLVGLKRDLRSDPETIRKLARQQLKPVQYEEGMEVANRIGAYRYVECSAKLNSGIESVFQGMRQSLDEGDRQKMDPITGAQLSNTPAKPKGSGGCCIIS
ncbi:Rho GTPase rho1 [Powellomyces hirtus]|nr:Rho GTPase rho1 [Powellomyces hirtus]